MFRAWLKTKVAARVVVHTTDRQSVEGLLTEVARDGIVLSNAKYLDTDNGEPAPLHGETFIPKRGVAFLQVKEGQL